MKKSTKFVSLADVISDFVNSEEGKRFKEQQLAERAKSPARYNLKHDMQAFQYTQAADCNFSCAMHRFQTLNQMRKEWERNPDIMHEDFDELYDEYQQYVLDAADYIRKYKERKALLEQAVIDEDNSK